MAVRAHDGEAETKPVAHSARLLLGAFVVAVAVAVAAVLAIIFTLPPAPRPKGPRRASRIE